MKLRDLTKPQWDAALEAARVLKAANPNAPEDIARFREARASLVDLLPPDTDERSVITQAIHWDSLNTFALVFAGLPNEVTA